MRRLVVISLVIGLAACAGGSEPGVTPPPDGPGAPASLSVVAGDGQSAAPGTTLSVKLTVMVRDAANIAVPGVVVQFSVDSGGGTLTTAAATTSTNGVAVGPDWTLGTAAGTHVASARVANLPPLKFRAQAFGPAAQTLFDNSQVPTGGGTLRYSKPGDALDGLAIVVPPGAFPTPTQWNVVADSTIKLTLPTDFTQVGPVLVISNAQGYADSVITLSMPMPLSGDLVVAPFFHDPATGTLEGIPLVSRTATAVTLATRHFSADLMAIPGAVSQANLSLRSAMALGFGGVRIVWVTSLSSKLVGTFSSSFRPGVDDWEFANRGEYISPRGICEGMSITAMYYHYFHKQGAVGLYHQFDQSLTNLLDNVQGIRFAGSAQGDYETNAATGVNQVADLTNQGALTGVNTADLTSTWILLTLKLNSAPVLLALRRPGGGHAVVAYAATSNGTRTDVSFADPNHPGQGRTMTFQGGS